MSELKGQVPCPDCGTTSDVKADKRKFLYLVCPDCGVFKYQTHKGQARLRARLEQATAGAASVESGTAEPAPENPVQVPKTKPEKRRLLPSIFKRATA